MAAKSLFQRREQTKTRKAVTGIDIDKPADRQRTDRCIFQYTDTLKGRKAGKHIYKTRNKLSGKLTNETKTITKILFYQHTVIHI